jgi:hypothetical protein
MYWANCFRSAKFSARVADEERNRSRASVKASESSLVMTLTHQDPSGDKIRLHGWVVPVFVRRALRGFSEVHEQKW